MRIAISSLPPINHPHTNRHEATRNRYVPCVLILVAMAVGGCGRPTAGEWDAAVFDGDRALEDVQAQLVFGARIPGSQGHDQAGDWILAELQGAGWETQVQHFSYRGVPMRNLIARGGPETEGGILLGAHYDTRPVADRDSTSPDLPVPGANDGASGVAILLELARVIPVDDLPVPVRLVFFDGEDSARVDGWPGILGSAEYTSRAEDLPNQAVIVDMVGDADLQLYFEGNSDPALASEIWGVASRLGHEAFIPTVRHSLTDDHTPFLRQGIPAVDIIDFDYPYWHTTGDTLDKVSAASLAQVGDTLQAWLRTAVDDQ